MELGLRELGVLPVPIPGGPDQGVWRIVRVAVVVVVLQPARRLDGDYRGVQHGPAVLRPLRAVRLTIRHRRRQGRHGGDRGNAEHLPQEVRPRARGVIDHELRADLRHAADEEGEHGQRRGHDGKWHGLLFHLHRDLHAELLRARLLGGRPQGPILRAVMAPDGPDGLDSLAQGRRNEEMHRPTVLHQRLGQGDQRVGVASVLDGQERDVLGLVGIPAHRDGVRWRAAARGTARGGWGGRGAPRALPA
mmetsp:Transcript_105232/g.322573  ORF Transcript_105232/g.322573 Transcript_105232/m.322573 type:complete len:248 (+) Transcript_105232:663-1406(+)